MRRFYSEDRITGAQVVIRGDEAQHIARVLRLKPGETVVVFDGSGFDSTMVLEEVTASMVSGTVIERNRAATEPAFPITLVQGLAKGDKMDLIIQKAVELGVSRIIPLETDHAVVNLDEKKARGKAERWNRIALEACKQCQRSCPPRVEPVAELADIIRLAGDAPVLFFYEGARHVSLQDTLEQVGPKARERGMFLVIGPEGGFSEREASTAEKAGFYSAGLGPRILRTETAGLAALSIIMYVLGDMGTGR